RHQSPGRGASGDRRRRHCAAGAQVSDGRRRLGVLTVKLLRALLGGVVALVLASPAIAQQASLASDVKATFLLRFGLFVSWPAGSQGSDFTICTIDGGDVARALSQLTGAERIGGRPVRHVEIDRRAPRPGECEMLYIGDASPALLQALRREQSGPVLTVTDAARGNERGMIHFEV